MRLRAVKGRYYYERHFELLGNAAGISRQNTQPAATFDAICLVINLHRPVDVRTRIRELMGERRAIDQIIKFRCILDVLRLVFWRFCVLIWIHDALLDE